jgi:hypothetical protein
MVRWKRLPLLVGGLVLVLLGVATQPALAVADLVVNSCCSDPVQAGLSNEYNAGVINLGDTATPVELFIILAGQFGEPEHIRIFGELGFECEVRHDVGISAAIRCTGKLRPGAAVTVQFPARGLAPGVGKIVVTANPNRSIPDANFDTNFIQRDVTFH